MTLDARVMKLELRWAHLSDVKSMTAAELEAWLVASFGYLPSDEELRSLVETEHGDA